MFLQLRFVCQVGPAAFVNSHSIDIAAIKNVVSYTHDIRLAVMYRADIGMYISCLTSLYLDTNWTRQGVWCQLHSLLQR